MGDLSEQGIELEFIAATEQEIELESLAAAEHREDVRAPPSPATTPATTAPATESKKKKGMLNIFSRHKKDKVDKCAKDSNAPETVGESSKAGEVAASIERTASLTELEGDALPQNASGPSSVVLDDVDLAGPSSSAPPPTDRVGPDANPHPSVPTIKITPATPRARSFMDGEVDPYLLATPRLDNQPENRRGQGSKPKDPGFRYHPLRIPEEPGDYPRITSPRNLKNFGELPYQTRHIYIPVARHWIDHRPVAKYAGEPLFKLSKACPYILVSRILAARLQLIVETPIILPEEVKELAAERGLDVATLEGYDMALLTILGALWDD